MQKILGSLVVANPDAQQHIEQWNQKNQQLESLRQELSKKFTVELSQRINNFQAEINQQASTISRQFPEVAELFMAILIIGRLSS